MEILNKTLNQMPVVFSSNEFSNRAQKNGLSKREVSNGVIAIFLHRNAYQLDTKRMWRKKHELESQNVIQKSITNKISDAIELLKQNGYKVMKPINEWVEL